MAMYRYQVVSVGMWRGKIKRWNTTFSYDGSGSIQTFHDAVSAVSYPNPGDIIGACSGGVASVAVYDAAGGAPIARTEYFDWQVPSEWIPFTGTAWAGVDPTTPMDASGESALLIVGKLGGLSSTGKPVTTRKYIHAVPSRTAAAYSDPDIAPAVATALAAVFPPRLMMAPDGSVPVSVMAEPYYFNHQRVRGRRRPVRAVAAGAFSLGVLAGGGATVSGAGERVPGGEF